MAVLVVVNTALVATIWLKKEKAVEPPRRGDARDYLVKELRLDKAQQAAFDSLRKAHFEKIAHYQKETHFAKDRLFTALSNDQTDSVIKKIRNSVTERIGEVQAAIDRETFDHFSHLRRLLNEQQKQKFDSVIQNVLRTLDPQGPGRGGPMPHGGPPPDERTGSPPEGREGLRPPPQGTPPPY